MGSDDALVRQGEEPTKDNAIPPASRLVSIVGHAIMACISMGLAFLVFSTVAMHIPPFNLEKLERLRPGMSKDQVVAVLGAPSHDHVVQWTYAGLGWPMVHIYFDVNERFESSEYDY